MLEHLVSDSSSYRTRRVFIWSDSLCNEIDSHNSWKAMPKRSSCFLNHAHFLCESANPGALQGSEKKKYLLWPNNTGFRLFRYRGFMQKLERLGNDRMDRTTSYLLQVNGAFSLLRTCNLYCDFWMAALLTFS